MKSDIARLCLGSAPYTLQNDARKIIAFAHEAGIRWLDTAVSYPFYSVPEGWRICTKFKAADLHRAALDAATVDVVLSHEAKAEHLIRAVKAAGFKGTVGVSMYWPDVRPSWAQAVQFPFSLADRRYAALAKAEMYTRFARSVFLQGKLLSMGYSVADCLGFVLRQPVDYVVVGVNSVTELEEIVRAAEALPEHVPEIPAPNLTDKELDPRMWSK